jgi:hypothetical protein
LIVILLASSHFWALRPSSPLIVASKGAAAARLAPD